MCDGDRVKELIYSVMKADRTHTTVEFCKCKATSQGVDSQPTAKRLCKRLQPAYLHAHTNASRVANLARI